MKLSISEPEPRESGAILVCDEDHNDIAEFFHNEHATVGQSYETALMLARKLVSSACDDEHQQTRQGVCPSCAGHGVVRVPVVGGPYMSISERESHDNECEE